MTCTDITTTCLSITAIGVAIFVYLKTATLQRQDIRASLASERLALINDIAKYSAPVEIIKKGAAKHY